MDIQVYATEFDVTAENGTANILLKNVDVSQVVAEIGSEEVLHCIDAADIADFLARQEMDCGDE